jgi:MFS family permease
MADPTTPAPLLPEEDLSPEALPPRPLVHHLALTVYWLSNTLLWGALLQLGLQSRVRDWYPLEETAGYYFGIVGCVGGIVGTITQIVIGAFSDRSLNKWGRRRPFIVSGSLAAVAGLALLGMAPSFWPFLGALVLVQLFSNVALGPFTALLPDTINRKEHGKASGFMGVARLVGDTGGLVLAGVLLSAGKWGKTAPREQIVAFHDQRFFVLCLLIAGFIAVATVYTVLVIKERPLRRRPVGSVLQIILQSFKVDVRGNRDFFWLCLSRGITDLGFYIFLAVTPYFVCYAMRIVDYEGQTVLIMLPAIAMATLSSIPSGLLSDRMGRKPLIYAAQYLMALGAVGFMLAPSVTWAYVAALPAGVAYGVFTAVEWALACTLLPKGEAARYLGVWNAAATVPQILSMPIAGIVGSAVAQHWLREGMPLAERLPGLGWRLDFGLAAVFCLVGAYFLRHVHERRGTGACETAAPL